MPTAVDSPVHPAATSPRNNPPLHTQITNLWDALVVVEGITVGPVFANVLDPRYGTWVADGVTDNSSVVANVIADLPAVGGILVIPPYNGTAILDSVTITKALTIVQMPGGTIKKKPGSTNRGMFFVPGVQTAPFKLIVGGIFDMNGPGPLGVPAAYANGQAFEVVFGLRSTNMVVEMAGGSIQNCSEDAFLFRNCGICKVYGFGTINNVFNIGIEVSLTAAGTDGYVGPASIPTPEIFEVDGITLSNVNDLLNGAGNGVAISAGFNNTVSSLLLKQFIVSHCKFKGNLRDIWSENGAAVGPNYTEMFNWHDNNSDSALQVSMGVVGARAGSIHHNNIINAGTAGPLGIGADVAGIIISQSVGYNNVCVDVSNNTVTDLRGSAVDYTDRGIKLTAASVSANVVNNIIQGHKTDGIYIGKGGHIVCTGNNINGRGTGVTATGINIVGPVDDMVLGPNDINNVTGEISGTTNVTQFRRSILTADVAYNPPNVVAGTEILTSTVTVPGAVVGDPVSMGFDQSLQGMKLTGYVSAANTVQGVLANGTGGDINLAAGNLRATVMRP